MILMGINPGVAFNPPSAALPLRKLNPTLAALHRAAGDVKRRFELSHSVPEPRMASVASAAAQLASRLKRSSTCFNCRAQSPSMVAAGPLSLLPPIMTLAASVLLKNTLVAMLVGTWTGSLLLNGGNPIVAVLRTFDKYVVNSVADVEHAGVILFTTVLGGVIGLVQKSGGALGLASLIKGFFTSRKSGALSTMGLGSLIFFDDYSSILIVGNSLRPLLAAVRLSPAKFAFISHTMGVCLASLAPLSSWVGVLIGYIAGALSQLGGEAVLGAASCDPFLTLLATLPYRFLPLSMLVFLLIGALTGRDFGPMLAAERAVVRDAGSTDDGGSAEGADEATVVENGPGPLDPAPGTPLRAINALLPFGIVIVSSFAGMVLQGLNAIRAMPELVRPAATLVNALRFSDSVSALVWGSVAGWIVSTTLVMQQKILNLQDAMTAWVEGAKDVLEPTLVLVLAWALGAVIADVGTADFLAGALQAGLPAWALPALVSTLCYIISFASGSAVGTMGIVFPLVGPLALSLSGGSISFLRHCFGSIMGGSVFGNLCSPLADTSILTVLATRCALPTHISTCLGYTALVAVVSLVFGDLAVGLGLYGPFAGLTVCSAVLLGVKALVGRSVEAAPTKAGATI